MAYSVEERLYVVKTFYQRNHFVTVQRQFPKKFEQMKGSVTHAVNSLIQKHEVTCSDCDNKKGVMWRYKVSTHTVQRCFWTRSSASDSDKIYDMMFPASRYKKKKILTRHHATGFGMWRVVETAYCSRKAAVTWVLSGLLQFAQQYHATLSCMCFNEQAEHEILGLQKSARNHEDVSPSCKMHRVAWKSVSESLHGSVCGRHHNKVEVTAANPK
jgi:hypothetical protein